MFKRSDYKHNQKRLRVAFVSSCLPRRCGIATFTASLSTALKSYLGENACAFIAMNNATGKYTYPPEVVFQITQDNLEDYRRAADLINASDIDLVSLQHEFGLFGGTDGSYITEFLGHLKKPAVITLHTVLAKPTATQYKAVIEAAAFAQSMIVMNELALDMLKDTYNIPGDKTKLIYHGVPDVFYVDPLYYKSQLGLANREILLTFGFLNPNKGLENAIKALPPIVEKHPHVLYIILGITHPEVKKRYGEGYRNMLEGLVQQLDLGEHVLFHDEFVDDETLGQYVGAADIVVCPYLSEEQITSGVLSTALGRGKPVISTPYYHAKKTLDGGRGKLVNFNDPEGITGAALELLGNHESRLAMAAEAFTLGKDMFWSKIARRYVDLFACAVNETQVSFLPVQSYTPFLPPVNLGFLQSLTDDTGIIRDTDHGIAKRAGGYAADDIARALVVCTEYHNLYHTDTALPLVDRYLSFIKHARQESGWFAQAMNYRRQFTTPPGKENTFGRCLWGLGAVCRLCRDDGQIHTAKALFQVSLPLLKQLREPVAMAYSACGLEAYLQKYPQAKRAGASLDDIATRLLQLYREHACDKWTWFEAHLTPGYTRLAQALLLAYRYFQEKAYLETGLSALDFLTGTLYREGFFDFGGPENRSRHRENNALPGQQPLNAGALVETYLLAFMLSGQSEYLELGYAAFQWFLGRNRLGKPVYSAATGACADGLNRNDISRNKGAGATTAFLIALLALYRFELRVRPYFSSPSLEEIMTKAQVNNSKRCPATPPAPGARRGKNFFVPPYSDWPLYR